MVSSGDLSYGGTVDFDNDDINFDRLTSGFGIDLGGVLEFAKADSDMYQYRIGLSITDIGGINYKKVMSDADAEHYLKGMGNEALLNRENRVFSWKEKQYFLKDSHAIIGAGHFVATYRSSLFKGTYKYPKLKFKNGLEREYIDMLSDQRGFYRLSTVETYAYHLGNILDESLPTFSRRVNRLEPELIQKAFQNEKPSILPYPLRIILFKILKRLYKL